MALSPVDGVGDVVVVIGVLSADVVEDSSVVVGALSVDVVGDAALPVGALPADVVGDAAVVAGALPQTGSPGTGSSSGPPARNTVGTHTPARPVPTHAHQWLARFPTEYFDPSDWHRNG